LGDDYDDNRYEEEYRPNDWYTEDFNPDSGQGGLPTSIAGLPRGTSGITGHIPRYYRDILKQIYDKFWIKEFTCVEVRKIPGLKKFKCQQLRMFNNYGAVTSTIKRVRGEKPIRMWKLTSGAANYFAERS
jgi:hypothetical protein